MQATRITFGRVSNALKDCLKAAEADGTNRENNQTPLDLSPRGQGGTNPGKREHLAATVDILNAARQFYLNFFLAHPDKLMERVEVIAKKTGEVSERLVSADKLLTWAEFHT